MAEKTKAELYNGGPFAVVSKHKKWRGGRHWSPGVHVFSEAKEIEALGSVDEVRKMLITIDGDKQSFELQFPGDKPKKEEPKK